MPFEAIRTISEAEENAKRIKSDALADARKIIAEAEEYGRRAADSAAKKAETELSELGVQSDEKAKAAIAERTGVTANKVAVMRAKGEKELNKAAQLIVERIVGG